jgi:hypothetical protein
MRGSVHLLREVQFPRQLFELGWKDGKAGTGPLWLFPRLRLAGRISTRFDMRVMTLLAAWHLISRKRGQDYLGWCLANSSGVNLPALT